MTDLNKENNYRIIENKYTINDILVDVKSLTDDYTCSICFEFIYKKIPLQCKNGCWNCEDCWVKHLETSRNKQCPQCRCIIRSINHLSRNRFIEKEFNKKLIYCPNSFKFCNNGNQKLIEDDKDGCKEVKQLNQLENHIKECSYRFVKCRFKDCIEIIRFNQIEKHELNCENRLELCKYCKKDEIAHRKLEEHYLVCPSKPIPCNQCNKDIERSLIDDHLSLECTETEIPCKFSDVGCTFKIKRSKLTELTDHLNTINHSIFMEKKLELQSELITKLTNLMNEEYIKKDELLQKSPNTNLLYNNKWYISNYLEKVKDLEPNVIINSSIFMMGGYGLYLSFYPNGLGNEDGEDGNRDDRSIIFLFSKPGQKEFTAKYTFTLINHKDSNLNISLTMDEQDYKEFGKGHYFEVDDFSILKGWLNQDGDLLFDVKIEIINKNKIEFLKT